MVLARSPSSIRRFRKASAMSMVRIFQRLAPLGRFPQIQGRIDEVRGSWQDYSLPCHRQGVYSWPEHIHNESDLLRAVALLLYKGGDPCCDGFWPPSADLAPVPDSFQVPLGLQPGHLFLWLFFVFLERLIISFYFYHPCSLGHKFGRLELGLCGSSGWEYSPRGDALSDTQRCGTAEPPGDIYVRVVGLCRDGGHQGAPPPRGAFIWRSSASRSAPAAPAACRCFWRRVTSVSLISVPSLSTRRSTSGWSCRTSSRATLAERPHDTHPLYFWQRRGAGFSFPQCILRSLVPAPLLLIPVRPCASWRRARVHIGAACSCTYPFARTTWAPASPDLRPTHERPLPIGRTSFVTVCFHHLSLQCCKKILLKISPCKIVTSQVLPCHIWLIGTSQKATGLPIGWRLVHLSSGLMKTTCPSHGGARSW